MSFIDPKSLVDARIQLHYAAQFMAVAADTLLERQPDYSHSALSWNRDRQLFTSALIVGNSNFYVGLDPVKLISLVLDEQGQTLAALELNGKTFAEGFAWLRSELKSLGVEAEKVVPPTYPYDDFQTVRSPRGTF
ncbi:MAG: hypothetical protein HC925_06390 [Coleofasciculaceae cyanobacterium SM2_3_26]|nr:hypothetical protein [Coleofasciculaceae cyanobacterium SM2_3_26]